MSTRIEKTGGLAVASLLLVAAVHAVSACGGDSDGPGVAIATSAQRFCEAAAAAVERCGSPSACDQALTGDCSSVAGMLADGVLDSASSCLAGGSSLGACLVEARASLEPSEAKRAFGAKFCDECGMGVPKCEDALFGGDGDTGAIGALLLPLSDSLVTAVGDECAHGFGCAAKFTSCAEKVLAERALPQESLKCLMSSLKSDKPPKETCSAPASTAASGSSGGGGSGGEPGSSATTGGGGEVSTICLDKVVTLSNLTLSKGDTEFNGHGPLVTLEVSLQAQPDGVTIERCVTMEETVADWTKGSRCESEFVKAPNSGLVTSVQHKLAYEDSDHDEDDVLAEAIDPMYDASFIKSAKCVGDRVGEDICSDAACSHCAIELGCFRVHAP